nr:Chain B, Spindle pole body-associated protein sad1 [Schizosaccharomyces pombe 972h-]
GPLSDNEEFENVVKNGH